MSSPYIHGVFDVGDMGLVDIVNDDGGEALLAYLLTNHGLQHLILRTDVTIVSYLKMEFIIIILPSTVQAFLAIL